MLEEAFGRKTLAPGFAALIPNWTGFQPWPVSLSLYEEMTRSWTGFLQKRSTKDMDALQRILSIRSPAEFTSLSIAFWQDAAQDYYSEFAELQKTFWSAATAVR